MGQSSYLLVTESLNLLPDRTRRPSMKVVPQALGIGMLVGPSEGCLGFRKIQNVVVGVFVTLIR